MITKRRFLSLACCSSLASLSPGLGQVAQSHVVRGQAHILVGFTAGGNTDFVARLLANEMKGYSSAVIVENRPGASGRIALEGLKSSVADGSVMTLTPSPMIALFPHIYRSLRYDPFADFIPVTMICRLPLLVAVGPMVPDQAKTLADFAAWCRANPQLATHGLGGGAGTSMHFTGVMLARAAGFELIHVPYQGAAQTVQDLLGDQIASAVLPFDVPLPHTQSGKLRALATTGPRRSTLLPEVPTVKEAGYPSLEFVDWFGVFLPANTPAETVNNLDRTIRDVLEKAEAKAAFAKISYEIAGVSRADFARLIRDDFERWGPIVKASGFSVLD
jgi:tripartite-type tricarboxylate transporter receptor subunit TctC